ncbi:MAG: DUF1566 domain-containing protein [Pseudomonadota bacterium]
MSGKLMMFFCMCFCFIFSALPVFPYQLPDTGQHKCYDNEKEIPCPSPGQPFYGQDAQYQGYQLSYTDNGNGTVTDLNTGLVWQQKHATDRPWEEACEYCEGLTLGGRTDWRLPTKRELASLPHYGVYDPSIDTVYFPDCNWGYWSSSPSTYYSDRFAWYVDFYDGEVSDHYMTMDMRVRCVRGGASGPIFDFVNNGNGTVTDKITGLVWQQGDGHNDGEGRTWEEALAFCQTLSLGGHTDWRLPNVRELESLTDVNRFILPSIDPLFDCRSSYYWSSTTHAEDMDQAWEVYFGYGGADYWGKSSSTVYCVRCVRGGPGGLLDTPTVTTTAISSITATTASSGGNVTSDGGSSVTAKGVCWSTAANPTTSDSHTSDGTGTGSFTSSITGLSPGTTYHVRAYATNSVGPGYGSDVSFTTSYASTLYVSISGDCGDKTPCYTFIQNAIDEAATGSGILIAQGTYDESIVLDESKALTLQGGWDSTFTTQSSYTTVNSITISNGTIAVDKLVIQ